MGFSEIKGDKLVFSFPELGSDCNLEVGFVRTLRLPDDNKEYPLPPGLGQFDLAHVDDHKQALPSSWSEHGGVFFPMWQAEAMWLSFHNPSGWPFAVKIAAGKINALTGEAWRNPLSAKGDKQDYMVSPTQPWIDGFCIGEGVVRQFVAMPQGSGYTAEEQITGKAEHGGVQIIVYPMTVEARQRLAPPVQRRRGSYHAMDGAMGGALSASASLESCDMMAAPMAASNSSHSVSRSMAKKASPAKEMGLAAGGLMRQEIYADIYDQHGREVWSDQYARCFVHLMDALDYESVMGKAPKAMPPTANDYRAYGLPWFEYYDSKSKALSGSKTLAGLDSVAAMGVKKGEKPLGGKEGVVSPQATKPVKIGPVAKGLDGSW